MAGFCCALSGVNIFETKVGLVVLVVGTLFPDIDHPKSILGRLLKPLSSWINKQYGHRTVTHSLAMLLGTTFLFALVESQVAGSTRLAIIFGFAYFSHLVLDMLTLMGVPILWPFSKNPFVMPANPAWRIRTDDRRAEAIAFCIFIALGVLMQPLLRDGFWTTYNRAFGTMKHLYSEFVASEDLLEVEYRARVGSRQIEGKGIAVDASANEVILIEDEQFKSLNTTDYVVEEVIPNHTGRAYTYEDVSFAGIALDSLNELLNGEWIMEVSISGNRDFVTIADEIVTQGNKFKEEHIMQMWIEDTKHDTSEVGFVYDMDPRIGVKQAELKALKQENQQRVDDIRKMEQDIELLEEYLDRGDKPLPELDLIYADLVKTKKELAGADKPEHGRELVLAEEIAQLRRQQATKNQEKRIQHEMKLEAERPRQLSFHGSATILKIQPIQDEKETSGDGITFLDPHRLRATSGTKCRHF